MHFIRCNTRKAALKEYPFAYRVIPCDGGYMAFDNPQDYQLWLNQK